MSTSSSSSASASASASLSSSSPSSWSPVGSPSSSSSAASSVPAFSAFWSSPSPSSSASASSSAASSSSASSASSSCFASTSASWPAPDVPSCASRGFVSSPSLMPLWAGVPSRPGFAVWPRLLSPPSCSSAAALPCLTSSRTFLAASTSALRAATVAATLSCACCKPPNIASKRSLNSVNARLSNAPLALGLFRAATASIDRRDSSHSKDVKMSLKPSTCVPTSTSLTQAPSTNTLRWLSMAVLQGASSAFAVLSLASTAPFASSAFASASWARSAGSLATHFCQPRTPSSMQATLASSKPNTSKSTVPSKPQRPIRSPFPEMRTSLRPSSNSWVTS
mmetsp:Transcript_24991/g.83434  ORF Transcript_24991/g.83434 Transcript_24991/m.83434 type:complete len:338 (+) Transcript_24991:360-1373(+)